MLLGVFLGIRFTTVSAVIGVEQPQEMIEAQMRPHKTVSVRMVEVTLLETLEQDLEQETGAGPVLCDQCSARAFVKVTLSAGILTFCMHHYNKNAHALTEKGAVAKLLNV